MSDPIHCYPFITISSEKTNSSNVNAILHAGKALVYARNRFYAQIDGFAHVEWASSLEVVDVSSDDERITPT